MKTSIPRIRSVTDKATGHTIHILRPDLKTDRSSVNVDVQEILDGFYGDGYVAGGYAFVIWDRLGASSCSLACYRGASVHRAHAPEFVKGVLQNTIAKTW